MGEGGDTRSNTFFNATFFSVNCYRQQTKLREGNVFYTYLSFCSKRGEWCCPCPAEGEVCCEGVCCKGGAVKGGSVKGCHKEGFCEGVDMKGKCREGIPTS